MNILQLNTTSTKLNLTSFQNVNCGEKCIAYINPSNIHVTTCGTFINADNVIPQRNSEKVKLVELASNLTEVHSLIDNQPVIALSHTGLLNSQKLFDFCKKKTVLENGTVEHTDCKHVKLLLNSRDIIIGK
jgi:hypothetical protein